MSGSCVRYSAEDLLDYLHGNFAISEDGFDSDIERFESDYDDDLEPELPPKKADNAEMI